MTRGVSLLQIRKEWILPAVTLNLTLLIHDIDQLFDKTSYLYGHFCSPFYPFYRGGKIDLHNPIVLVTTKKTTIHNFAGAYYKTLLFNYISYFNYPKANRPEYNERSSNLQPCRSSAAVLFFLRDTVDIVGRFYGNEWKITPFWIHRFFSQRKILMIWIFDLILNFSKEMHPN